jgi:methionine biosynthesis protein MetW
LTTSIGNIRLASPDDHAAGLTGEPLNALRYDGNSDHPQEVAGMLHALMPSGVRVLDVGCGTGSVAVIANRDRNNTVIGIEPDSQRADVARSRGLTVYTGFLDDAFLAAHEPFDVVMASDVLEHTASPAELLKLMTMAIKPDGIVLVSVPNIAHWSVRLNLLRGRFDHEPVGIMDATHLRWFTARTISSLFEQSGLQVIEMRQTAGVTLPVYGRGVWRWKRGKWRAIRGLTRAFPLLFGVQHVLKARVRA